MEKDKSKKLIEGLRQLNETIQDLIYKMQKTIAEVDHRVKKARKALNKPYVCRELRQDNLKRLFDHRLN